MNVCCRFFLLRLLFIVVLCISIDIFVFFQFHSTFWRCFYESVRSQSAFFVYTVRVFRVPLLLCCVSWLFLVFIFTILGFASMGDCFYGVWTLFLQVVVSV